MPRTLLTEEELQAGPPSVGGSTGGGVTPDRLQDLKVQAGTQILEQGGKISDIKTAFEWLEPIAQTDKETASKVFSKRLAILEYYWFSAEKELVGEGGTAPQRLMGQARQWYESSPAFRQYYDFKKTLGATLAKEAGDVGNISWVEQKNQLDALPVPGHTTKVEGQGKFNQVRASYSNINPKEYYDSIRKGNVPTEIKGLDVTSTGVDTATDLAGEGVPTSLSDMSGLQRLFGTTEETYKPDLPGSRYAGEAGMLAGPLLGKLTGLPPGLRTLLSGTIGQTYENIGQEGLPLTPEAGKPYTSQSTLEKLLAVSPGTRPFSTEKNREMLGQTTPAAALDLLLQGHNVISGARKNIAKNLPKIPVPEILKPYLDEVGTKIGTSTKQFSREAGRISQKYKVPEPVTDALSKRSFLGETSRGVTGTVKDTAAAKLQDIERRILSGAIKNKSQLIANLDALDSLIYGVGGFGREMFGRVASAGIGAVGFGLGSKLFNRD